jgi:hypothetical protein
MDTAENTSAPGFFNKIWLKYGVIAGFTAVAITTIYYVFDDSLLTDMVFSFLPLVSLLVISIIAAYQLRKSQGNYLAYSQGVTTSLGAFSIGIVISTAFSLILYYVIDPALLKKVTNEQLKKVAEMVEEGKLPKQSYDEMVKRITEQGPEIFLFNLLIGMVGLIVVALIIFLISSAILRREPKTQI